MSSPIVCLSLRNACSQSWSQDHSTSFLFRYASRSWNTNGKLFRRNLLHSDNLRQSCKLKPSQRCIERTRPANDSTNSSVAGGSPASLIVTLFISWIGFFCQGSCSTTGITAKFRWVWSLFGKTHPAHCTINNRYPRILENQGSLTLLQLLVSSDILYQLFYTFLDWFLSEHALNLFIFSGLSVWYYTTESRQSHGTRVYIRNRREMVVLKCSLELWVKQISVLVLKIDQLLLDSFPPHHSNHTLPLLPPSWNLS
ncbi:hypothetical protein Pst134EA_029083 [Puccinia striiformis f. sp. tritici]|uniref:hypothetical protein n=1 Tax=Puccinia striiformis f. sp. tritici TaxID=168172 RepID=UPI002007B46F|nr:hypothetical protein Pst134EA_029083 [Puccinia striiformis f. sp. tritici]KAH9447096.1 hypothetical protein Pst134EA_029083 [Puccinia striiformis f. sp. tritici]